MNRIEAPVLQPIEKIKFVSPVVKTFGGHSELLWMKEVNDETVRLELHFNAGSIHGECLVAGAVNALLLSGTKEKSTTQIHNELAQLGAFVDTDVTTEAAVIAVYCLREHLDAVLEILIDAVENVVFPQQELEDLIRDRKQSFLVNSQKVGMAAKRLFTGEFFSNDKRYGRVIQLEDYDTLTVEKLKEFHRQFYLKGLKRIVCVANTEESLLMKWTDRLAIWSDQNATSFISEIKNTPVDLYEEREDAMQTAIRIGMPMFNKKAEDYTGMYVLQTILGDYFGSRLMSNLREDKGYTYGVGTAVVETYKTGYLIIGTEVKKEAQADAILQIKHEISRLKEELVGEEELQLVKNYILGQLLKNADGSNALTDLFLAVHIYDLTLDFYNEFIEKVKSISAEELLRLAQEYLRLENMTMIRIG